MDLRRIYVLLKAEIFTVSVSQLHVEGVNNYYKMYEWSLVTADELCFLQDFLSDCLRPHHSSLVACFKESKLTCALPAAVVFLGRAHQFAVEVLLPVLSKPHVPPVVLQSPRCEVRIEP